MSSVPPEDAGGYRPSPYGPPGSGSDPSSYGGEHPYGGGPSYPAPGSGGGYGDRGRGPHGQHSSSGGKQLSSFEPLAIASLAVGVLALCQGLLLGAAALTMGLIARHRAAEVGNKDSERLAIAGIAVGAFAAVTWAILQVVGRLQTGSYYPYLY